LEADVDVRAVDSWAPPKRESTIRDLVETGTLSVRELLIPHGFFESRRLLPEQTFPRGEVRALEECMFEDTFHASQRGDNVDTIVVQLPQLAIMTL
jgi:hypothetical protein